jgi:hypothetical protein
MMRRARTWRVFVCAMATAALGGSAARAGDPALADQLFRDGKTLMSAHDYVRACPKLAESFREDPATGTLLALAVCQEQTGRLASSWGSYQGVVARSQREGRPDREQAARERMNALEPRLSSLRIDVPPDVARLSALVVTRDDAPVPPSAWGNAMPADGGTHLVRATAPGHLAWQQSIALDREKDRKTVTVGPLVLGQVAVVPHPAMSLTTVNSQPEVTAVTTDAGGRYRRVGLALAGAGLVALGVGTGFAIYAKHLDSESRQDGHCRDDTGCDSTGLSLNASARSQGNTATILFAAGGVVLAGGLGCYLFGRHTSANPGSIALAPTMSVHFGGAQLQGSF